MAQGEESNREKTVSVSSFGARSPNNYRRRGDVRKFRLDAVPETDDLHPARDL